jgi:hypothetical protein
LAVDLVAAPLELRNICSDDLSTRNSEMNVKPSTLKLADKVEATIEALVTLVGNFK